MEEGGNPPSSSSELSSSDEGEEVEATAASIDDAEIVRLESVLDGAPYHYDYHLALVKILRVALGVREYSEKLRRARERMSSTFPLTEELWIQWIEDEMLLEDDDNRSFVKGLYEKAVGDYLSVRIWLDYCKFTMRGMKEGECGLGDVRNTFERAVSAVGLHVKRGSEIWDAYREFEILILESVKEVAESEDDQEVTSQVQRIANLFQRQLSVPLIGMETTMREFEVWAEENSMAVKDYSEGYEWALKACKECARFEEALSVSDMPHLSEYKAYIGHEMKGGEPARVECLYERCLADNCLFADIWIEYTHYVNQNVKVKDSVLACHKKAVRNCPWVSLLWQNYLHALEEFEESAADGTKMEAILEEALECGLDDPLALWQCYLDGVWRRVRPRIADDAAQAIIRVAYKKAIGQCSVDPTSSLKRSWAAIEAFLGNLDEVTVLWEEVMNEGHRRKATMWVEYIGAVQRCGNCDVEKVRQLLRESVLRSSDNPWKVCEAWKAFERLEGSLKEWNEAKERCEAKMAEFLENQAKRREREKEAWKEKGKGNKRPVRENERRHGNRREDAGRRSVEGQPKHKRRKVEDDNDDGGQGGQDGQQVKHEEGERSVPAAADSDGATFEKPRKIYDPDLTAFVSNLLFHVTEDELKAHLADCGEITGINIIQDAKFKIKNFAYVEFANPDCVSKALEMDRKELNGKPAFVSQYGKIRKTFPKPRYPLQLSENTLFVSNVKFLATSDELKELFEKHGTVKEVRKPIDSLGRPKGYAYVEYESPSSARKAIQNLDGFMLQGRPLSVALSNPPPSSSKQAAAAAPSVVTGVGGAGRYLYQKEEVQRNAPQRRLAQVNSLVPRAVQRKESGQAKPLTNAEFRKFLTK